jgi:hypothetical protein
MPDPISKLSKENQEIIYKALEKVAEVVASGRHPEDVVVAMFKNNEISLPHLPYLVYSYNNGIVVNQLREGTNVKEKLASVPIIKLDKVLKRCKVV